MTLEILTPSRTPGEGIVLVQNQIFRATLPTGESVEIKVVEQGFLYSIDGGASEYLKSGALQLADQVIAMAEPFV